MKALWNEQTIAQAVSAKVSGHWFASRVEIDSRRVQLGDLFVAIKGERVDGHDYVADALARGAVAAVVSRIPEGLPRGASLVVVNDTMAALLSMARFSRARSNAKIIGVTGSVGKTSAKEIIRLALSVHGKTHASAGNYNNHIGMPLSLANLPADAAFGVFELGMNHEGEIRFLAEILRPHVALITNIEAVHLEFFKDLQGIADAKSEIFECSEGNNHSNNHSNKAAIINADNVFCDYLAAKAGACGISKIITFGEKETANARLLSYSPTVSGAEIIAAFSEQNIAFAIGATGKHFAKLAVAALAIADYLKLPLPKTAASFVDFTESKGRGNIISVPVSGGNFLLIDDSYNASPVAMVAAIARANEIWKMRGSKGRKIAALGDMLELGSQASSLHAELADSLLGNGFNLIFTAGALMQHLFSALPAEIRGQHMPQAQQLALPLRKILQPDDILLVKGSHGSKMYELSTMLAVSS